MASTTEKLNLPLVSILLLTHNRADYIGQAISSVISQTYLNWELTIIDDGSTDHTVDIVSSFNDERIRYIRHTDNQKLLARRQESLNYAKGKYTAVLDSDDLWSSSEKLAKQVTWLEANEDVVVVGSYIQLIDETGKHIGQVTYRVTDETIRQHILYKNQFAHSAVLMRTATLKQTAGYRFPLDEDLDLFLQLGRFGTFTNLTEFLTSYRVHSNSISKVRKKQMLDNVLLIIQKHKKDYPGFYKGYLKYQAYRLFLSLL